MNTEDVYKMLEGKAFLIPGMYVNFSSNIPQSYKQRDIMYSFIPNGILGNNIMGYVYYHYSNHAYISDAKIPFIELLTYEVTGSKTNFKWRKA